MSAVICEVHLPDVSGIPADDAMNSFVFQDSNPIGVPNALAVDVSPLIIAFYNDGPTPVSTFLANSISRAANACKVVTYQLAAEGSMTPVTPIGGPILEVDFTLGASGAGTDLPREVAAAVSYTAMHVGLPEDVPGGAPGPAGDTHPRARHRGRIFLGPLTTGVVGAGVNGPGLTVPFMNACAGNAATLMVAVGSVAGLTENWVVWSRKDDHLYPITGGWVDNAFDTQRRRGIKATIRTNYGIS